MVIGTIFVMWVINLLVLILPWWFLYMLGYFLLRVLLLVLMISQCWRGNVHVCACLRSMCVCMCVCVHVHACEYVYYVCVWMCVCDVHMCEYACVWVHTHMYVLYMFHTHTYSNINMESNGTCYGIDALKERRCNSSSDDYITKEYHSGRLGKTTVQKCICKWCTMEITITSLVCT